MLKMINEAVATSVAAALRNSLRNLQLPRTQTQDDLQ